MVVANNDKNDAKKQQQPDPSLTLPRYTDLPALKEVMQNIMNYPINTLNWHCMVDYINTLINMVTSLDKTVSDDKITIQTKDEQMKKLIDYSNSLRNRLIILLDKEFDEVFKHANAIRTIRDDYLKEFTFTNDKQMPKVHPGLTAWNNTFKKPEEAKQ